MSKSLEEQDEQSHSQTQSISTVDPEAIESARIAGLKYVTDNQPGIQRKGTGRGFSYINTNGARINDQAERKRIEALAIPPAWQDVWICPLPNGHLQATGRDAKGRKQYRYHSAWREVRNQVKFDRMIAFGHALPRIRQVTEEHLRLKTMSREKILAIVVKLLEATHIRIGNNEYAKQNQSFGLTTLRNRHIEVFSTKIRFNFRGKRGIEHEIELNDRRLARAIKRCQEIPGHELFQYYDEDNERRTVSSDDVNTYLRDISDEELTAKDFRTWAGTLETAWHLETLGNADTKTATKKNIKQAIQHAAKELGNRAATCRKYYVHPIVLQAYEEGWLLDVLHTERDKFLEQNDKPNEYDLQPEEYALLRLLEQQSEKISS